MTVIQKRLRSESGFESPGFSVDTSGNLTVTGSIATSGISTSALTISGISVIETSDSTASLSTDIKHSSLLTVGVLSALEVSGPILLTSAGTIQVVGNTSITGELEISAGTKILSNSGLNIGELEQATLAASSTSVSLTSNVTDGQLELKVTKGELAETGMSIDALTRTVALYDGQPTSQVSVGGNLSVNGTGQFASITLTEEGTLPNQLVTKSYVDSKVPALAIALGS